MFLIVVVFITYKSLFSIVFSFSVNLIFALLCFQVTAAVQANNTRKIGRVMHISLVKGPGGLGFSITTRDNAPAGAQTPIYIKNIMPKGAAIEEGTLRPGDRLLEVNGASVDGKTQSEVVAMLRNAEPNAKLELTVSRHNPAANVVGIGTEGESAQEAIRIKEDLGSNRNGQ